jgi:carbonic anhydrase
MKKNIIALVAFGGLLISGCAGQAISGEKSAEHKKAHWVYDGEMGPYNWGKINKTCAEGKSQSPINIITKDTVAFNTSNALEFHESTQAVLSHEVDNGHAIKITPDDDHGITIKGEHYKLLQFHFHGRSENLINGRQYDMEMHLVHQNAKGELAVVAVMIEEGKHNTVFNNVVDHINGGDLNVVTASLLPNDTEHYYHFMGSLTTPPCSENVKWYVMKEAIQLDKKQIISFRVHHNYNYRPIQDLNGRQIQSK